jgi:hypothetical protein
VKQLHGRPASHTGTSPEGGGSGNVGCLRVGALLFLVGCAEDVAQSAHLVLMTGGNLS